MVIVALAEGFETVEALAPVDLLRRAGVDVRMAGCSALDVMSGQGVTVRADMLVGDADADLFEMLILPGGGKGVDNLRACGELQALLLDMAEKEKLIGAICAAPVLLAEHGLLKGRRAVCYPSVRGELARLGAKLQDDERVTHDRNIITAEAAGSSVEFGLKLLAMLRGWEASETQRRAICSEAFPRALT